MYSVQIIIDQCSKNTIKCMYTSSETNVNECGVPVPR